MRIGSGGRSGASQRARARALLALLSLLSVSATALPASAAAATHTLTVDLGTSDGSGTITSSPSGISCPPTCSAPFLEGEYVSLDVTFNWATTRWYGWSGPVVPGMCFADTSHCDVYMGTSHTVGASLLKMQTLTVQKTGRGRVVDTSGETDIDCGGLCEGYPGTGRNVTLHPVPAEGWGLGSWDPACGPGDCVVSLDGPLTVSAHFVDVVPPPVPALKPLPPMPEGAFGVAWAVTDDSSVTGFDIRYRKAPTNGAFGDFVTWKSVGRGQRGAAFEPKPGTAYCFSIRSVDTAHVSPWSSERCTFAVTGDALLETTGQWSTVAWAMGQTMSVSYDAGARVTLAGTGDAFYMRAAHCADCGKVRVFWDGKFVRDVSLRASSYALKIVRLVAFPGTRIGKLQIKVLKPTVGIDAIGVRHVP